MASKRPKIESKEALIAYLKAHPETELPFVEECWENAVVIAEKNAKEGIVPVVVQTETDKDGNVVSTKKVTKGSRPTNPVSVYFKLAGLNKYKTKGLELAAQQAVTTVQLTESQKEIEEVYFGENEDDNEFSEYSDEILTWISYMKPLEREFIKKRYLEYYDNYDINDGADKAGLKGVLSLELELFRIDMIRAQGKKVNLLDETKVRSMLDTTLQSLKWTKKQRSAREDMAQNKFSVWLDKLVKEGEFIPNPKVYDPDEIDFIVQTALEAQRKMLT